MLTMEPALSRRSTGQSGAQLLRFHVFDGATRIVIEVHSEDDARCLCVEMGWELICCCEG